MTRSEILTALRERIVSFAASRIGSGGTALLSPDDLAQETLLLMEQKYSHVESIEELLPLALKIVRYKLLGTFSKSTRRGEYSAVPVEEVPLPDILDDPEAALLRKERAGQLQQAIAALGERCREIFRLRMEGLGFPEMATRLGAGSINTMYTWDSRCRQQLIERLYRGDKQRAQ